jgi:hypothetical protein
MDPMDRPSAEPPNAADMVAVIAASMSQSRDALKAARQMIAIYAIKALLDGADVLTIAHQCGFGEGADPDDKPQNELETILSNMGIPPALASQMTIIGPRGPMGAEGENPICDLHEFLGEALRVFIYEQAVKQNGGRS